MPKCNVDGRSRVGVAKHFRRDHKDYRSWRDVFIKKDAPDFILQPPAPEPSGSPASSPSPLTSHQQPDHNLQVVAADLQDVPLVTTAPPAGSTLQQILQPLSVIQQPQVIYLQPVQPTEFIMV